MTDIVRCDSCGVAMAKDDKTGVNIVERGRFTDEHAPLKTRKFGLSLHIAPITKVRGGPEPYGFNITYNVVTGEPIKVDSVSTPAIYLDGYKMSATGHLCPRCRARLLRIAASKLLTMADNYDRRKSLYLEEKPKAVPHGRDAVKEAYGRRPDTD